ncbi:MAG: threonine--tRNA ligase [Candidatus Thermoplasmatota archaeon]|nr:threonine--tRNA ligase [Candidatus Thermoplasmatota archaeon]
MKVLFIHSDFMRYEVKDKTRFAEEISPGEEKGEVKEALVAFLTVEKGDEGQIEETSAAAVEEIVTTAEKVSVRTVMIYPYAHLSSSLAGPSMAKKALELMTASLRDRGYDVTAPPFGWYKAFVLSCKGHPLAESFREIEAGEKAEKVEETAEEDFLVLTPEGKEFEPESYTEGSEAFQVLMRKEALKEEHKAAEKPAYLRLCKKFGMEWEPMSDVGHMRYNPRGAIIFDLCADYATAVVNSLGLPVMQVKGTNMFDLSEPAVSEHAELFGDRLYTIETKRRSFVMRYAACHQQFAMIKDWNFSYKQLPFGAFEVADSYRLEQSGETMLAFRVRRMNMPDLHVFCRDDEEAREWLLNLHDRIMREAKDLGRDYEVLINVSSREAYEKEKELILEILKREEKEGLIHFYLSGKNYYWTVNIEYVIMDAIKREREIGTVQIDVGNAERFGMSFADKDGKKRFPIILHSAMLGTIERYIYMVLDTAVKMEEEGRVGHLPLWLNPEQVRFVPVSDDHLQRASDLAKELRKGSVRVGVDDTGGSVSKRVRDAKTNWISYVIVIGEKEMKGDRLVVYDRERDENREMTLGGLLGEIEKKMEGRPFRQMYVPSEISKRPQF